MSKKHTAVPWENCGSGRIYTECKPGKASWKICQLADTGTEAIRDMAANAALIAAAPEMLGALRLIAANVDGLDMPAELWEQVHAAIAKAEGRENG